MVSLVECLLRDCRKLSCLHWPVLVGLFWIAFPVSGVAQSHRAKTCVRAHPTASATVRGFVFKTYEAANVDDPACLRIYRDGKVVYHLADDEQMYYLGQPANAPYKIPVAPNGADLTGDGRPDMIVTAWSGGAHCCFTHLIFELEPKLRLLATIDDGDADLSHFEKLGKSRGYSYMTRDIWSYWPASFASSVSHKVILSWSGERFRLDWDKMRYPPPTPRQWASALSDVNGALNDPANAREALGETLWDTTLDLIYTDHSDLAWKFVREANPKALAGDNPSLGEFCLKLKKSAYWPELEPTLKNAPKECLNAKDRAEK